MGTHSKLSPSGSPQWMNCSGSINFIDQLDIPPLCSFYAMEGTAAHYLGEQCLRHNWDAEELLGKTVWVEEWGHSDPDCEEENFFHTGLRPAPRKKTRGMVKIYKEKFLVGPDMVEAVQIHLNHIRDHIVEAEIQADTHVELLLEIRCPLTHLGVEGLDGGTSDTVLINREHMYIVVVDYKHGPGYAR